MASTFTPHGHDKTNVSVPETPQSGFLTVTELAKVWNLGRDTVRRLFEDEPRISWHEWTGS